MKKHPKSHTHVIEQVPSDYYQKGVEKNILQRLWHTNKLNTVLILLENSRMTSPKVILDVGCASGWFVSKLHNKFPQAKCYGVDIYEKAIAFGKKRYPKIDFAVADAHKLPFKGSTFDFIVCTEVLEHVENPRDVLLEIKRVLKKNGSAIIELDSGSWLFSITWFLWRKLHGKVWTDSHLHTFNVAKLEKVLLANGFTILSKETFNLGMAMAFHVGK